MYPSTRIEDTDTKPPSFCPTCFELLSWHLERRGCRALTD
jgi:predicted Zn-dependent protease